MAYVLHLSDLHLTSDPRLDGLGDVKSAAVDHSSLASKFVGMRDSLATLGRSLKVEGIELDAVVITGDVANKGEADGFDMVSPLLAGLAVAPERVLIVPGNHDVVPWLPVGDPARWSNFVKLRTDGYLTPDLLGVDVDAAGKPLAGAGGHPQPVLTSADGSVVIVGVNSADQCVISEGVSPELDASLSRLASASDPDVKALVQALHHKRKVDVARVAPAQMSFATKAFGPAQPAQLRIVALHHSVKPTGVNEEVKPYEAITNLGSFRGWIAENAVDVILHGHKHVTRIMNDVQDVPSGGTHRFVELAAPPIEITTQDSGVVGWLIHVEGPEPRARGIYVFPVPWQTSGMYTISDERSDFVPLDPELELGFIDGETSAAVHRKIMAAGPRFSTLNRPIICRVDEGASCKELPPTYPVDGGAPMDAERFAKTVGQWQAGDTAGSMKFNHGERLYRRTNQIESVIKALSRDRGTTRALAVLVTSDDVRKPKKGFPSFATAQFLLRGDRLSVVATYRKQELPHWWPVNVAELAEMQQRVIDRFPDPLVAGSITTIATVPSIGSAPPRVMVPFLDTLELSDLFERVVPLAFGSDVSHDRVVELWQELFDDWTPGQGTAADGDPISIRGIGYLKTAIRALRGSIPAGSVLPKIEARLTTLELANSAYEDDQDREKWSAAVRPAIADVLDLVKDAESAPGG